ncbi:nudix hydrolase 13, mitochondrial [Ricinus communis]|uniref:Diphosphoinositol polyphosphate phosphohydrolase, putative n=1 Tax=Ricinus communis TaxID=3988 RepID=B9RG15_RICCO|nr:nudix hydrolase 13, mitochondrial [Ricinus communis]EEF50136.1 diphosphoinositol polyphosphate phosphohydrolase, putative [Ricinus communis]|eukprot:XP_002512684.1 nudix hydrolase 13, mitochondrial [Ricinus communis]
MSSLLARTGRHRQRYQDNLRLVAGCIPYKLYKNVEDQSCRVEDKILVLMISTPNRDDLVFPKGGWEDDESVEEAASREAMEEAGVQGLLGENPLGVWEFRSKSSQNSSSSVGGCRGYMFALEVTEELGHWPGQASYTRKWLVTEEAFKRCRYDWMKEALKNFVADMSKERRHGKKKESGVSETGAGSQMGSSSLWGKETGVLRRLKNPVASAV